MDKERGRSKKESAKMRDKDDKMKTKEKQRVKNGREGEGWGRRREQREQREVREKREKKKDKQRWCFRLSGRHGRKKGGGEREKARGFTRREKPTESEMKEGDARVGGRQGKTGEERGRMRR